MAVTRWTGHGTDAQYWTSDNPYLHAWYRFGDDNPLSVKLKVGDNLGNRSYASGLLVDSGKRQFHLLHTGSADTYIKPTSGIAPLVGGSGIIFGSQPSTTWAAGSHPESLWINRECYHLAGGGGGQGFNPVPYGLATLSSGFVLACWMQIPNETTNSTTIRQIFGDQEGASLSTTATFSLGWRPSDRTLHAAYRDSASNTRTVTTTSFPYPPLNDEPFFVAVRLHREGPPKGANDDVVFSVGGSGAISIHLGTHVSGLLQAGYTEFTSTDLRMNRKNFATEFYSIGQDSTTSRNATSSTRHLPPGTIMDEFVIVADGRMPKRRLEYLMNSGITYISENDPLSVDFAPVSPGTDDLVAYWTFDNQRGTNSAPATSGLGIDLILNGATNLSPVVGVRGGSGLAVGNRVGENETLAGAGGMTAFPHVPKASGLNYLYPDFVSNTNKQMTWIGWMRSRQNVSSHYGGSVGWFDDQAPTDRHPLAFSTADWRNILANSVSIDRGRGYNYTPSGTNTQTTRGGITNVAGEGGRFAGPRPGIWQLWAFVMDMEHGRIYSVLDCKYHRPEGDFFSSRSGLDKDAVGPNGAFLFSSTNEDSSSNYVEIDDWAVYNRALTLPEMSGYALSGIAVQPITAPMNTTLKQTLGYWEFSDDNVEVYDPEGLSGTRYNDSSWYRHHLTNISGLFSISSTTLNTRINNQSVQIKTSGAIMALERIFTGANLDLSSELVFPSSGFSCGAWMQLPSHGSNGFHRLDGDHHVMGSWGTDIDGHSWQLGITDNKPFISFRPAVLALQTVTGTEDVPSGTPFFIGAIVTPSGSNFTAEVYLHTGDFDDSDGFNLVGRDTALSLNTPLNPSSASGFSLFNVPGRQQGFPSGTLVQGPFLYAGAFSAQELFEVSRAGVDNIPLASGGISSTDPSNISHWKFDYAGDRVIDFRKEQNSLFAINQDGHTVGVTRGIHGSGVVIRQQEYYDTLPFNANSRRLDLGSGTQSWTFLSWVYPPAATNLDRHYLMAKSDGTSGIQIFTPNDSLQLGANASGALTLGENGDLAPDTWNHVAIVFDRDNNEFTTIINGRYAGASFGTLYEVPTNNSGMALGGRGDQQLNAIAGGAAFSGFLDDAMIFSRALSLPEISGLAANTLNVNDGSTQFTAGPVGAWVSGIPQFLVSGLIAAWLHGQAQDLALVGGYVSGVEGFCIPIGGWLHGKASVSGQIAAYLHGAGLASGVFGHFVHGQGQVSGFFGHYEFGACEGSSEFDIILNFSVIANHDFDARIGVEKTKLKEFDARLGVIRITAPPDCTLEMPLVGTIASGVPYTLTIQGSGIARDNKKVARTRFTFADFKDAEKGTLIDGEPNSGLYEATRVFDTPGLYNVKIEVLDSYGYRTSCVRPFLLLPSGAESGTFLNSLPGISIESNLNTGSAIQTVLFSHSISGIDTTSGLLEYTDFADQQESTVNSLEMPVGTQFTDFIRRHDYSMPGRYAPVWAVSGEFGIVSDTISDGIDYIV